MMNEQATALHRTARADEIPPYCHRQPGMTPEEGAVAAVKALQVCLLCDALAIFWEMRREAQEAEKCAGECRHHPGRKNATAAHGASGRGIRCPIARRDQPLSKGSHE